MTEKQQQIFFPDVNGRFTSRWCSSLLHLKEASLSGHIKDVCIQIKDARFIFNLVPSVCSFVTF